MQCYFENAYDKIFVYEFDINYNFLLEVAVITEQIF